MFSYVYIDLNGWEDTRNNSLIIIILIIIFLIFMRGLKLSAWPNMFDVMVLLPWEVLGTDKQTNNEHCNF